MARHGPASALRRRRTVFRTEPACLEQRDRTMDLDERLAFGSRREPRDPVERALVAITPQHRVEHRVRERVGLETRRGKPPPTQQTRPLEPRERLAYAWRRAWMWNHRRHAVEQLRDLARREHRLGVGRRQQRVAHEERVCRIEHFVSRMFRPCGSLATALKPQRSPCSARARPELAGERGEDA
ncbi:MAG: hypothetical protein ACO3QC_11505 [Phycisphaerales bacterium]